MKRIKVLALAGLMGASATVAGGNIWDFSTLLTNEPFYGQAMVPGAITCWTTEGEPGPPSYSSPCYNQTGGYWFGYGDLGGITYDAAQNTDLTQSGAMITAEYCNSGNSLCNGQASAESRILYKGAGLGNATEGIHVKFSTIAGDDNDPSLAGIGFNWRAKDGVDYGGVKTENITARNGLCLVYKASADGVDVELGWNEASNGYNTYIVTLVASSGFKTVDLPWDAFEQSYEGSTSPKTTALAEAEALKIVYKNKTATPTDVIFTLKEIGWINSCTGSVSAKSVATVAAPQFNLAGRMLSIANISAPTQVQIINMHGSVVAQKTLGQNEPMNLANMPNGVYLVRSAKLGISQKIILK